MPVVVTVSREGRRIDDSVVGVAVERSSAPGVVKAAGEGVAS